MKQAKIRPILKSLHNLQHDEGGNYMAESALLCVCGGDELQVSLIWHIQAGHS